MSLKEALMERFRLANSTAAIAILFGLIAAWSWNDKTIMGAIIGGALTWLWKTKGEA